MLGEREGGVEGPCSPYQLHQDLVCLHPKPRLWETGLSESLERSVLSCTIEETPSQAASAWPSSAVSLTSVKADGNVGKVQQ